MAKLTQGKGRQLQVNGNGASTSANSQSQRNKRLVGTRADGGTSEQAIDSLLQAAAEPSGSFLQVAQAQLKVLCSPGVGFDAATLVLRTVSSFKPGSPLSFYTASSCPQHARALDAHDAHELKLGHEPEEGKTAASFPASEPSGELSASAEEVLVQQGGLTLPSSGAYVRALSSASLLIGLLIIEPSPHEHSVSSHRHSSRSHSNRHDDALRNVCDTLCTAYLLDQHSSLQRRLTDRREQQLWDMSERLRAPVDAVNGMSSLLQKQLEPGTPPRDLANALASQGADLTEAAQELESLLFTPDTFRIPELPDDISRAMMSPSDDARRQESQRVKKQHSDPAGIRPHAAEGATCDVATELASILGSAEGVASQLGVKLVARGVPERGTRSFAAGRERVRAALSNAFENVLGRAQAGERVAIDVLSTKSGVGVFVTLRAGDTPAERDVSQQKKRREIKLPWKDSNRGDPGAAQSAEIARKEAERAGGLATFNSSGAEVWLPQPDKSKARGEHESAAAASLPQ